MKVKLIIISIILLLVMVFASGCIPFMEKIGLINPTDEEQLSPEKGGPPDGLVKVLIGFKEKPGAAQQAMVQGVGGKIKYTYNFIPAMAASIPEKAIEALKKNPNVRYVELDGQVFALDGELDNSWGVKHIGAGVVHDSLNKGWGVKVAIIDSGIDYTHSDLDGNYKGGIDIGDGDVYPMDDSAIAGHGTHVAGIVAAEDNYISDIGVVGVAPEAHLYAVKVFNTAGKAYESDVIAGIEWSMGEWLDLDGNGKIDKGPFGSEEGVTVDVINMSIGSPSSSESLMIVCDVAYAAEIVLVAAAGNSGNPPGRGDNIIYPAAYDSVIAVAATDQDDVRARWSSTGPAVELAAPGVGIYSTYIGDDYTTYSGTSMASPHVAGVAALVIASGTTGVSAVRGKLIGTADDLGDEGWDWLYGNGLVDAAEAAEAAGAENKPPTVSITSPADGDTFNSGVAISFGGTASDPEDGGLTAELDWTSNIDGQIGIGGIFSTTLSDGTHIITANVIDSGDKTGSDSISITVGTSSNIMQVSDIAFSAKKAGKNLFLYTTVDVSLKDNGAVDGVKVTMTLADGTNSWNFSSDTGSDGTVKFTLKAHPGNYTATVTEVSHPDYTWDEVVTTNSCFLNGDGTVE